MEYTRKFRSDGNVIIKRILATIHLKDGDNEVVYYITHWAELILFVPLFEMLNNKLSKKWGLMLSALKREWEKKYQYICNENNVHHYRICFGD